MIGACPQCDGPVRSMVVDHAWQYGPGPDAAWLRAHVPIRICDGCGFKFVDSEGADIMDAVTIEHARGLRHG